MNPFQSLILAWVFVFVGDTSLVHAAKDDVPSSDKVHETVIFHMDFSQVPVGETPDDLLVLDGDFAVRESGGDKLLELPGKPLDAFGVLFGPRAKDGLCVQARIRAEATRRRDPRFGVGLGGLGGYRLRMVPARGELEIVLHDQAVATTPFKWKSSRWTTLKLRIDKTAGHAWRVRGKAWLSDQPEPKAWTISHTTNDLPLAGQASIWGTPYSGKPIQFDDLIVKQSRRESGSKASGG